MKAKLPSPLDVRIIGDVLLVFCLRHDDIPLYSATVISHNTWPGITEAAKLRQDNIELRTIIAYLCGTLGRHLSPKEKKALRSAELQEPTRDQREDDDS